MAHWVIGFGRHQGQPVKMPHVSESQLMEEMYDREQVSESMNKLSLLYE